MVSHCHLKLHLPNDMVWSSFHVLVCHLHIFFGKVSIKVVCPFFDRVVCFLIVKF